MVGGAVLAGHKSTVVVVIVVLRGRVEDHPFAKYQAND